MILKMDKTRSIILTILILLFSVLTTEKIHPSCASESDKEEWWNAAWPYRRAITIYGRTDAEQSDYQILVNLNEKNFDFKHTEAGGDDIRFMDFEGNILSYWIEQWNPENKYAAIWVKAPKIPATTDEAETIYMYYGNLEASNTSNEKTTFIVGDTFTQPDGDHLDSSLWVDVDSTLPDSPRPFSPTDIQNEQLRVYVASASNLWAFKGVRGRGLIGTGFAIDWRMKHSSATTNIVSALHVGPMTTFENPPKDPYYIKISFEDWGPRRTETFKVQYMISGVSYTIYSEVHVADDMMHDVRLIFRSDKYIEVHLDGALRYNTTLPELTLTSGYVYLYSYVQGTMFHDTRFDDIRVRKYVYPEPRIEVSAEEKIGATPTPSPSPIHTPKPTPTPNPTSTPSPTPSPTPTPKPRPTWYEQHGAWITVIILAMIAVAAYLYTRRR